MSTNTVEQSKNVSLRKMEQSGQRKSVTDQDKKLDPNANTINNGNDESLSSPTKETKFNNASILSPQSTKSLNLTDDNNSNHSTNTNVTTSSSITTASSPSHPNINRTFIKNSKLTANANTSRYNYVQNTQSQQQQIQSNTRPEQKCKENQNESKQKMLPFDNELVLQNLIRAQIEYLFSDYHLTNDTYLLARMQDNPQHWLSIDELCHNQKIRCLTIKKDRILRALRESKYLQLSPEQDKVRRPDFTLPKLKPNRDLRRTVFLYGIPSNKTETDIRKLLSQYGHIKRIHFQPTGDGVSGNDNNGNDQNIDDEAPNKAVAQLIMKKKFLFPSRYSQSDHDTDNESHKGFDIGTPKGSMDGNQSDSSRTGRMSDYTHPVRNPNGDAQDFSHLKTCFVVFESQSQATKCVKARVRAIDGMRCIHKYDYNKVAKKFRTAQMKGEKLSFSPPPPNYQSPRVSSGDKYMPRGRSPGAQSDNGRYGNYNNNNNRYNNRRNFGNGNNGNNYGRGNRDYNSYRDRSHSQSSQGSNRGDRDYNDNRNNNNNGYQSQRHGRYQRNNNNNGNNYRSQTPNYKSHNNNNNQNNTFYNRFKGNNDDNDKENRQQRSRGLGSRRDRDSHDGSKNEPSSDVRYHSNRSDRNKWNNNPTYNRNQRQAQSTSPQRGQPHSAHNSVGNQSTMSANSEYKPILNSMNKQNQNPNQNSNGQDNNKQHGKPQQDIRKVQQQQQQSQGPVKPPQHNNVADVANQPTYAKKRQPVRAATPNMKANGSFVSPPQLSPHEVLSPPQDLKQTQSSVQPGSSTSTQKKMPKQPLQRSVSANTAPISTKSNNNANNKEPAAPQLYHPIGAAPVLPTREDIAALKAAGYNHELCYLPIDDANFMAGLDDLYHDPLIAYDAYFGVDQSGKPTSTHAAAQQLQQQQTKASSRNQRTHNQHSHSGQYSSSQRSSHSHSQHSQHSQSSSQYTTTAYVPQQRHHTQQQQQQQYAQTPTHHSSHNQQYAQQQNQYGQQQHPSLTTHSYSAHSYQQNGPSSAPYGPVTTNNNQNTGQQWRAEQWQLDKLEKFKAQKQAEQAAQHHQQQQQQQQKPVTALSVLSSHN